MKKILSVLMIITLVSTRSIGQTIPEKLDKLKSDRQTKEHAAKADSFLIDKKIIFSDTAKVIEPLATKRKLRTCRQKIKQ